MIFSHRIKQVRSQLNLSQKDFAEKIGVDQARVSRWEKEKSLPSSSSLIEIARLGVNINWLLTGEGEMMLEIQSSPKSKKIFSEEQKKEIERLIDERLKKN